MNLVVIDLDKVREIAKDLPGLDAALRSSMGTQFIKMAKPLRDYQEEAYIAGSIREENTARSFNESFEQFLKEKGYE